MNRKEAVNRAIVEGPVIKHRIKRRSRFITNSLAHVGDSKEGRSSGCVRKAVNGALLWTRTG